MCCTLRVQGVLGSRRAEAGLTAPSPTPPAHKTTSMPSSTGSAPSSPSTPATNSTSLESRMLGSMCPTCSTCSPPTSLEAPLSSRTLKDSWSETDAPTGTTTPHPPSLKWHTGTACTTTHSTKESKTMVVSLSSLALQSQFPLVAWSTWLSSSEQWLTSTCTTCTESATARTPLCLTPWLRLQMESTSQRRQSDSLRETTLHGCSRQRPSWTKRRSASWTSHPAPSEDPSSTT
mmetsp:Transcript_9442/g.7213  ORF Transcript_9442/g.7213 Transcript_9442/m.7213 type:complete len:233 (-) Transcript_9442:464-1162(-)